MAAGMAAGMSTGIRCELRCRGYAWDALCIEELRLLFAVWRWAAAAAESWRWGLVIKYGFDAAAPHCSSPAATQVARVITGGAFHSEAAE